ncbi:ATP-binding protein [Micromonospora sp. BRA006-A]|nr:ATP-binding protein [Micromonospora sp. BRA006-A]
MRGAISEVEAYDRVDVGEVAPAGVLGRAVGDVIHLLAELIENATTFSPPGTRVDVTGRSVPGGYTIEILDRGWACPRRPWPRPTASWPSHRSSTRPAAPGWGCSWWRDWPPGTVSGWSCGRRARPESWPRCSYRRNWSPTSRRWARTSPPGRNGGAWPR